MCGTIVEFLFIISGFWLMISGKVPEKIFNVLFGKGQYTITPAKARLFGLLLASPLPVIFGTIFLFTLFGVEDRQGFLLIFENAYLIILMLISIIVVRKIKQPEQAQTEITNIKKTKKRHKWEMPIGLWFIILFGFWAVLGLPPTYNIYSFSGSIVPWIVWFVGLGIIIAITGYIHYRKNNR